MNVLFGLLAPLHRRMTFCGQVGAIAGALVGMFFGLAQAEHGDDTVSFGRLVASAAIAAGIGWAAVLLVVGVWLRYGARTIALPSLVTVAVTSFLTVLFNDLADEPILASLIGIATGLLVGAVLCLLCLPLNDLWGCLRRVRGHQRG
jgi:hypothetical protein